MRNGSGKKMKKFLTGAVCGAAIAAASVVLLPVAAIKIAAHLSKPRGRQDRIVNRMRFPCLPTDGWPSRMK